MRSSALARGLPPTVLAVFLFAGTVKDTPVVGRLPFDLTAVAAAALVVVILHHLLRPGSRVPNAIIALLALWLAFVPGMLVAGGSSYATSKVLALVTLTLLAAVGAVVVLRDEHRIAVFAGAVVALGIVVAASTLAFPDPRALQSEKVAAAGATTINVARALGAAALVCLLAAATRRVRPWVGATAALFFVATMVLTGSRGPVVAVVLAAAVVFVARPSRVDRTTRLLGYVLAVAAAVAGTVAFAADQFAVQRALVVVGGSGDASSEVRLRLFAAVADLVPQHPWGLGWGRLGEYLPTSARLDPGVGQYAHNVVLEVLVEAGWLAGVVFVVVLAVGVVALLRSTASPAGAVMATLGVFFLVNAMVSGTVNDNRAMLAAVAVGLAIRCGDVTLLGGATVGASRSPVMSPIERADR